jgi:cobalt-zinc-cadmium efflux system membrane fusion protein
MKSGWFKTIRGATPLAFGLLLVAALQGCGEHKTKPEALMPTLDGGVVVFPEGSRQLATFTTEAAKTGGARIIQLTGRAVWNEDRTVRVFPPFAGRVTRILVRPGDAVHSGQALAVLASPDFGQAQSEARRAQADFELATRNLNRIRELHGAGVLPAKDLQTAEADLARADGEMKRAVSRAGLYGKSDTVDQTLSLTAPIGGVLVERNINPGQELRQDLQLSGSPAMFVITDPGHLWVQLDASERDLPVLKKGQRVTLRSSAWPNETFSATIDAVADGIDPTSRTIKVRGSVDNPARKLKGDMYVSAEVESGSEPALQLPSKAVFLLGDKNYVFLEDGPRRFRRVEVKVGADSGGTIEILSGLVAGQRAVVEGSLFLLRIQRQLETGAPV